MNGPDAVVHLLEAYGMLLECVREKEQPLLEPNRAGVRDALDEKMAGIFDRRQTGPVLRDTGWDPRNCSGSACRAGDPQANVRSRRP